MGLKDQPSFLTDQVAERAYTAVDLGRIRTGIALPRPRPPHVPQFSMPAVADNVTPAPDATLRPGIPVSAGVMIPYPMPRPSFRP